MDGDTKVVQDMNKWSSVLGRSVRKGMETVLKERKLWRNGLQADCKKCKQERSRGHRLKRRDLKRRSCCARRILQAQPDFVEQKSSIEELIHSRGHFAFFYPKFHCELNHIEMYWGYVKRCDTPRHAHTLVLGGIAPKNKNVADTDASPAG